MTVPSRLTRKLCEIPFDLSPRRPPFLFEPVKEWSSMRTVDINLSKSRKARSIVKAAKVVDFCSVSRGSAGQTDCRGNPEYQTSSW